MKIGTKEFPDKCPECGEKKGWVKKPNYRIVPEGGRPFSRISFICLRCKYETETVKIREDYLECNVLKNKEEDVTPYKPNIITKIISFFRQQLN